MPRSKEGLVRLIAREQLNDPRVVDAFRKVDRRDFVPAGTGPAAYGDRPISIPQNQTTSQPSLIARMIDAAAVKDGDRVLEVGTGYGFQTALLAQLCREVVSIERWRSLAQVARSNVERAGVGNAEVRVGDGWKGAPDKAPFDAIIVSAAADHLPEGLIEQLTEGGRLVIPLRVLQGDEVVLYEKRRGSVERSRLVTPALFVPLVPGMPADDG